MMISKNTLLYFFFLFCISCQQKTFGTISYSDIIPYGSSASIYLHKTVKNRNTEKVIDVIMSSDDLFEHLYLYENLKNAKNYLVKNDTIVVNDSTFKYFSEDRNIVLLKNVNHLKATDIIDQYFDSDLNMKNDIYIERRNLLFYFLICENYVVVEEDLSGDYSITSKFVKK